jgi:hypothetical protein
MLNLRSYHSVIDFCAQVDNKQVPIVLYRMYLLLCPSARQLWPDMPADARFLCNKVTTLGISIVLTSNLQRPQIRIVNIFKFFIWKMCIIYNTVIIISQKNVQFVQHCHRTNWLSLKNWHKYTKQHAAHSRCCNSRYLLNATLPTHSIT